MDAPSKWAFRSSAVFALFLLFSPILNAAGYRTANFIVDAPTPQLAKEIGDTAERCRRDLAIEWLGKELPPWSKPCPIKANVSPNLGAGGATSFIFDQGRVFGWRMTVQGSRERVLDSVIPHEVTHTIFASHFRQPVPRWADEGACTTVEHPSEIAKQERMLIDFLQTRRAIPFSAMFAMKEYPKDVLPLYAQGHSVAQFLIYQRGKAEFIAFLGNGLRDENWPRAVEEHYGYRDLLAFQNSWMDWVRNGRPELQLASNSDSGSTLVRGQDPGPHAADQSTAATNPLNRDRRRGSSAESAWPPLAATQPTRPNRATTGSASNPVESTIYEALSKGATPK